MLMRRLMLIAAVWAASIGGVATASELVAPTDRLTLLAEEIPGGFLKIDGTKGVGIYPDLISEAAKTAGVEIIFRFVPWGRAFREVERSEHFLTFPLTRLPEREDRYSWLVPLEQDDIVFVSLDNPINSLEEARELDRILVWQGSSMESFLINQGFDNVVSVGKTSALIRMLAHRRADAWFTIRPRDDEVFDVDGQSVEVVFGDVIHSESVWLAGGKGFVETDASRRFIGEMRALIDAGRLRQLRESIGQSVQ